MTMSSHNVSDMHACMQFGRAQAGCILQNKRRRHNNGAGPVIPNLEHLAKLCLSAGNKRIVKSSVALLVLCGGVAFA